MPTPATPTTENALATQLADDCRQVGERAKSAARLLAVTTGGQRNRWLHAAAQGLLESQDSILHANAKDLERATDAGLTPAQVDRLRLDIERVQSMVAALRQIATLPDPVGEVLEGQVRPNGLQVTRIRVPIGVVFMIYESRPNVTVDAAAICIKSGNSVILRGGKEAAGTNAALFDVLRAAAMQADLPADAVQWIDRPEREVVTELLGMPEWIDVVIPRGGAALVRHVTTHARMPVIKHETGNCHVYVDRDADLAMAERIVLDAKCQRPGVCNACESLLIHQDLLEPFAKRLIRSLIEAGVEVRGDQRVQGCDNRVVAITSDDDSREYLDMIVSARIVNSTSDALEHISRFSSGHTETIVTDNYSTAREFVQAIDSAAVMVNASTRLNDGSELGLGAEIGISTDRLHARGPCGIKELTTYKYVCWGSGQTKGMSG